MKINSLDYIRHQLWVQLRGSTCVQKVQRQQPTTPLQGLLSSFFLEINVFRGMSMLQRLCAGWMVSHAIDYVQVASVGTALRDGQRCSAPGFV